MGIHPSNTLTTRAQFARPRIKSRYCVDLAASHAECEANYWRLQRLLRAFQADERSFAIGDHLQLHISVTERSPYTTFIDIEQAQTAIPALASNVSVRVYHDAQMAEVVAFAHLQRILPHYDYPNPDMHQPDEKAQWNRFLGEWLSHCLQHGVPIDRPLSEFCEL
ncbi:MAG: DUF1249 domain-containing protein [Spongiibacteraceae bacterium]